MTADRRAGKKNKPPRSTAIGVPHTPLLPEIYSREQLQAVIDWLETFRFYRGADSHLAELIAAAIWVLQHAHDRIPHQKRRSGMKIGSTTNLTPPIDKDHNL